MNKQHRPLTRTLGALPFAVSATIAMAATTLVGCDDDNCLDPLDRNCSPAYEPTFDNIYDNTLMHSCAGGADCHGANPGRGGLVFLAKDSAHALLTGEGDGVMRAIAGDPECSLLVQRLETDDGEVLMPPGAKLPAAERCAIILWVAAGTPR